MCVREREREREESIASCRRGLRAHQADLWRADAAPRSILKKAHQKASSRERDSLWAGILVQTAACRLGKQQIKCLRSAVGSPATATPLEGRSFLSEQ